jgi:hypothetical protein
VPAQESSEKRALAEAAWAVFGTVFLGCSAFPVQRTKGHYIAGKNLALFTVLLLALKPSAASPDACISGWSLWLKTYISIRPPRSTWSG